MAVADRQRREKQQLRARILESARAIIQEEGYDAVTIRKIAARIEYSPMALYNHFSDKNAILLALAREVFAQLERSLPKPGKDPIATLRKAAVAYVQFGLKHPEEYQLIFMHCIEKTPASLSESGTLVPDDTGGRNAFERLVGYVEACRAAGQVQGQPFKVATALWAGIHGVVALQITQKDFPFGPPAEFAATVISILLRGIASDQEI